MLALRLLVAGLLLVGRGVGHPTFSGLNVWPKPREHSWPGEGRGPLRIEGTVASRDVDSSCGERIGAILAQTMAPLVTSRVHDTITNDRTWVSGAYAEVDAVCPVAARCSEDADCAGGSVCLIDPTRGRPWNSTHQCNPRSNADIGCGCCDSAVVSLSRVEVTCNDEGLRDEGPEAYTLEVTEDGAAGTAKVSIRASAEHGAAHALSVLSQLIQWDELLLHEHMNRNHGSPVAARGWLGTRWPLRIADAPRFAWRGLLLDTSRHTLRVDTLLKVIDGMAAARLNRFHWHIVDSTSFGYASSSHPEVAAEGSWSGSLQGGSGQSFNSAAYSAADIARVVNKAKSLFIDVMFELDTPAHTMSWSRSHPEAMADCWDWLESSKQHHDIAAGRIDMIAVDPTSASPARPLARELLRELAALSDSEYFHIGGDELNPACWNATQNIREFTRLKFGGDDTVAYRKLEAEWHRDVAASTVKEEGKVPVMWQPAGPLDPGTWDNTYETMPPETVFMLWYAGHTLAARAYADQQRNVVICSPFYINQLLPGDILEREITPKDLLVDRWRGVHTVDITAGLTAEQKLKVLGGQLSIWGEAVDDANVFNQAFTLGGAAAEALWSSSQSGHVEMSDLGDEVEGFATEQRFSRWICHLRGLEIAAAPLLPSHCQVIRHQTVVATPPAAAGSRGCGADAPAGGGGGGDWSTGAIVLSLLGGAMLGVVMSSLVVLKQRKRQAGSDFG